MENVTDALYMGFAALAFVLALSISISAFNRVTEVSQFMIDTRDRETGYTYVKYQDESGNLQIDRIVGAETIVPTLYRAFDENYIVRFLEHDGTQMNILKITKNGETFDTNEIRKQDITTGSLEESNEFFENLLNGNLNENPKFKSKKIQLSEELLHNGGFYDIINKSQWKETLGIYYYDDLQENSIDDINKTAIRVITYTKE